MAVTPSGISILLSPVQPAKAYSPIWVTLSGSSISSSVLQLSNSLLAIPVVPSSKVTVFSPDLIKGPPK